MKKLSIIIAGLLSHNANAAWGQNWGSMVWGQTSANVPMMDGIANIIFFGSLLALGVVTLNRWGLIKTLPILAVLSFIPSLVDADEIQLNAFQNGEVADADEVNENFIALKEALEELNEKVKSISCNAVEGVYLNDSCLRPELDIEVAFDNPVADYILLKIDTASFEFESSNFMDITFWVDGPTFDLNCKLENDSSGVVSTFIMNAGVGSSASNTVAIQDREIYTLSCTSVSANPFGGYQSIEISVDVNFS